ncbi:MAG: phosphatidate cytidylyltransferase [Candidatus Latescibacteria bacterium]|nr:phosphatidate cytidylyltransferase [Candidatus Latescibacterota bacterium]
MSPELRPPDPLLWPALTVVGAVLAIGIALALLITALRRTDAATRRSDWTRFLVLVGLVVAVLAAAALGPWGLLLPALILARGGWRELLAALEHRYGPAGPGGSTSLGCLGILGGLEGETCWALGSALAATWMALVLPLAAARRPLPLHRVLGVGLGMWLITAPLGLLLVLADRQFGAFAFLLMIAMAHDGFSGGFGRLLGRHPLCPQLSPGKTWEGALGGLGACVALGAALHFLVPAWPLERVLFSAAAIGLLALGGDLLASGIKREAGIKDFGRALPGIGGLLDKFDSLLFAAPGFYLLAHWGSP